MLRTLLLSCLIMLSMTSCSTNTHEIRTRVVTLCSGVIIMFENAEEITNTTTSLKRQILENNESISACRKHGQENVNGKHSDTP
jgi:hypothetical protein